MRPFRSIVCVLCTALWLLAACDDPDQIPLAEPSDPSLEEEWRLARFALRDGQHEQAVVLYQRVLDRAYARDDPKDIGDIGYEHALSLLRNGEANAAAVAVQKIRLELERRGTPAFPELYLLEAVALYEADHTDAAYAAASEALSKARPGDSATRTRAYFIHGMVAADNGAIADVRTALQNMRTPNHAALLADKEMLKGRLALLTNEAEAAQDAFALAADIRQELRDYIGMAKAMAAEAEAAQMTSNFPVAADLYFRAGRSAAAQKEVVQARKWLQLAYELATKHNLAAIAKDSLEQLQGLGDESRLQ